MVTVGPTVAGHLPQGPLSLGAAGVHLRGGAHLAVTTEPEPVATRDLADVADRAAPDLLGQLEDLRHGQDRPLARVLGPGAADAARITGKKLVVLNRGREDSADQPVRLGRHRDGYAVGQ
jgi:hypothetical protein